MKTNKPVTQAECDVANTLRDYERVHARHMQTSVFAACRPELNRELETARNAYLAAVKTLHPDWIVC